jgi:YegS/Rv2252/BmrU family lipid kinase
MAKFTKAAIIYNPVAGQRNVRSGIEQTIGRLAFAGWCTALYETTTELSAETLASDAVANGAEIVVAAGGDGTINAVINGIDPVQHPDIVLGVIPVGTANVWAREVGMTSFPQFTGDFKSAIDTLVNGVTTHIDLGKAGDRYFMLWAGVGLDALITQEVDFALKKLTGGLAFAEAGVRTGLKFTGAHVKVNIDGEQLVANSWFIGISNIRLYAHVPLAQNADMTDGLLDINMFSGSTPPEYLRHIVNILLGTHAHDPNVVSRQCRNVVIESDPPLPVHVDAEPIGYTPMSFHVLPSAIRVLVPREFVDGAEA